MEKRTYYVSVGSGEIVEDPTVTPWDFQVEANEEEIMKLGELLDQASRENMDVVYRITHPIEGGKIRHDLQDYDETLQRIYRMIYDLGNDEAKQFIQNMNVIEELGQNYDDGIRETDQ